MTDYPALTGDPVTQRHANMCASQGHAAHTVDGADTGTCPRCGEVTEAIPVVKVSRQLSAAYRAGWNASAKVDGPGMDAAEDRYARGHTEAQQDAWSAGWIDYASDYDYGHALTELTEGK